MVIQCEFLQSSYHTYIEESLDSFVVYFKELSHGSTGYCNREPNVFLLQEQTGKKTKSFFEVLASSGIHCRSHSSVIMEKWPESLSTYSDIITAIEHSKFDQMKYLPILALGGGVTGDLAGFVAATLLEESSCSNTNNFAIVDSSVRGQSCGQ